MNSHCEQRFRPYTIEGALLSHMCACTFLVHGKPLPIDPDDRDLVLRLHKRHCRDGDCDAAVIEIAVEQMFMGIGASIAATQAQGGDAKAVHDHLEAVAKHTWTRHVDCLLALAAGEPEPPPEGAMAYAKEVADRIVQNDQVRERYNIDPNFN